MQRCRERDREKERKKAKEGEREAEREGKRERKRGREGEITTTGRGVGVCTTLDLALLCTWHQAGTFVLLRLSLFVSDACMCCFVRPMRGMLREVSRRSI